MIRRAIAEYHSRSVDVVLTPAVTFVMLEAHHAPRNSLWSRIWPSAIAVSRWVLAAPDLAVSSRELGCGVGLVSMALAHRGVIADATDRVAHALAFTAQNAQQNGLATVSVSLLDWTELSGAPSLLIVGADVIYEPESPARLFELLHTRGLLLPGGTLVIGVPRRRAELYDRLHTALIDVGYLHTETAETVEWGGETEVIDVHVLVRPATDA